MSNRLKNIKNEYDLIIVGGGIYGATLLWEATLRGLSTILVEKGDFCSATSANSLKIIHGGLRYLQSFDLKRIRESADEQKRLLKIAPHLVQPLPCVIPTYQQIKNGKLAMFAALKLYKLICVGNKNYRNESIPPGKILSKDKLYTLIPVLNLSGITGGALWYDALNYNSVRLALEFILSAIECGADAFNYLEFQDLIIRKGRVVGIQAFDKLCREKLEILGKLVVNASGPWINNVCDGISVDQKKPQFHFAKAVNLIIPRKLSDCAFGLKDSSPPVDDYFQSNRFLFFVPWRGSTMIGTWYFVHNTSPEETALTEEEYFKCIGQVQRLLPDADIQEDEVCFVHSGLVPINPVEGNKNFVLKNNYSLIDHFLNGGPSGFISVLGVKYTTARNVAAKTINIVSEKLCRTLRSKNRENRLRSGAGIGNIDKFIQGVIDRQNKLSKETIRHLSLNYGTKYLDIEKLIHGDTELGHLIPGSKEAIKAELDYCIKNEFVYHLSDLLLRRSDIGSSRKPKDETISFSADFMAKEMGWSETRKKDEINSLRSYYNRCPITPKK